LNNVRNKATGKMPEVRASFSDSDTNNESNGDENADTFEQIQDDFADSFDAGNDTITEDQMEEPDGNSMVAPAPSIMAATLHKKVQMKTGPRNKKSDRRELGRIQGSTDLNELQEQESSQKRKRPGRPPKNQRSAGNDMEGQRPSKKPKTSDKTARESDPSSHPELDRVVENYVSRTGPLKGRSLYILKRETPMDSSTTHTRSGRVSVRPLAYWKNERCVYGDGEAAEGERYPLSTIKEIIRTEEQEPERRKTKKGRPSKKSKSKKTKDDVESEDEEDYADLWEKEAGVLHGYIRKWDPEAQTGADEEEVLGEPFPFLFSNALP
jgi:centromere protein C